MDRNGAVADYSETCGIVEAKLWGFGVNSAELRKRHAEWLDDFVVPILADGGSIALVGEASRSGAASHNQVLSIRRAKGVLEHLRRAVGVVRHVDATGSNGFDVRSVGGVGEAAAADAGRRDGTEEAFFRAVRVRAWSRPMPPVPPPPQPAPRKMVRRVSSRRWHSSNTRTGGGGNPLHDGGAGVLLADLVKKAFKAKTRGGTDQRSYVQVPPDHVVVRVKDETVIDDSLYTMNVSTTTYTTVITYEWGPRTPTVELARRIVSIPKGGSIAKARITHQVDVLPRSEVWRYTTAPDAVVFG